MGAGDWLLATAQAKRLHESNGRQVLVVSKRGFPQWHDVFENNPRLVRQHVPGCQRLINASGTRPYIEAKGVERWTWKRWDISPGELYLSAAEKAFAEPYAGSILIEPNTKVEGSNKAWIWERWQELVDRGLDFMQVGVAGSRRLERVKFVEAPSFRLACAVLARSRAFVGAEGGLHHAAAALGVPAVVLYSEFISPEFTGYPEHRNLRHAGKACGSRLPCAGCRAAMAAITVDEVERNLKEITGS